jgi:hypothetical protein
MHCVSTITHITRYSRRRAVGLFAPMILAPFRRLRLEMEESPTGNGTPFRQNHFRCNPSRMLVGRHSRFAANNALPRLMVLPRRDFPTHHPHSRGCSASRHHTCYASCGVTKRKDSSRPVQLHCHCPLQTCSEGTPVSVTPHGRVGWNDGTDTLSRRGSRHPRCRKLARREREALEKCVVYPDLVPSGI